MQRHTNRGSNAHSSTRYSAKRQSRRNFAMWVRYKVHTFYIFAKSELLSPFRIPTVTWCLSTLFATYNLFSQQNTVNSISIAIGWCNWMNTVFSFSVFTMYCSSTTIFQYYYAPEIIFESYTITPLLMFSYFWMESVRFVHFVSKRFVIWEQVTLPKYQSMENLDTGGQSRPVIRCQSKAAKTFQQMWSRAWGVCNIVYRTVMNNVPYSHARKSGLYILQWLCYSQSI